ncbi:HXXEE domain-containing protein [Enterococcus mediterraneensis]|uniref:HXXEE domain-containing protein n=1 Tax=Enterococcus mediterraneensis TaxID=2364791 RepID=UPI0013E0356A|nr:HXXEE domain-containing protein [Enterococcus mediterraneensis]
MDAIVFMLCVSLHNIEEALWLMEWQQKEMPNSRRNIKKNYFIFAVIGITVLLHLVSGLYLLFPNNTIFNYGFVGCVGVMLINAIVPHLALFIKTRKYCPGILTGSFLLIPLNSIILYKKISVHLTIGEVVFSTLIMGLLLILAILLLKKIAKRALSFLE